MGIACLVGVAACDGCRSGTPVDGKDASEASEAFVDAEGERVPPSPADDAAVAMAEASDAGADAALVGDAAEGDAAAAADGGATPCRLVYGPAEQPFRGPATLIASAGEMRVVVNVGGAPRVLTVPAGPPPGVKVAIAPPPVPSSYFAGRWPPCEVAGAWAYCEAPGGVVRRTRLGGATESKVLGTARPGTRIAAAALGADHTLVATIEGRRTSEGETLQAFVTLDDGEPVRLSEEGAGATAVRLVARGDHAVAVYIDARMALTPMHARTLSVRDGKLVVGDDAVVFVGGPPERGVDFALAGSPERLFALLPHARETMDFGMAAVQVLDPPKDDMPAVWSLYPNGLDPAPIAGTLGPATMADGAYVARVRPAAAPPRSPRVLELGRLDASGAFRSLGVVASGAGISDVAVATDSHGAVWILYGDVASTRLERRVCERGGV